MEGRRLVTQGTFEVRALLQDAGRFTLRGTLAESSAAEKASLCPPASDFFLQRLRIRDLERPLNHNTKNT